MAVPVHPRRTIFPWGAMSQFHRHPAVEYRDPAGHVGRWDGKHGWGPEPMVTHYDLLPHLTDLSGRTYPYPGPGDGSKGVVTVGGGAYWPMLVTSIRMLRRVNRDLPVEVWHRGRHEPIDRRMLAGLGDVRVRDAEAEATHHGDARVLGGWETKWYALANSQFDTVLYLDADAYVVADPGPLLADAAGKGYLGWWSEPAASDGNVKWPLVWPAAEANPPINFQGGQFVVHRPAVWAWVAATHWMCQHSDYYFYDRCVMGDQDCARAMVAATNPNRLHYGYTPFDRPAYICRVNSRPVVVHRVEDKWFPRWELPRELDAQQAHAETLLTLRG